LLATTTVLRRAGQWFLQSGIQEPSGGVARYYLSDSRRNAPVSNEITGYTLSALAYLCRRTGESQYLDAAHRTAGYLVRHAWDRNSFTFPFEPAYNGDSRFAYFFDCGIIVRGLLALYRLDPRPEYLGRADQAATAMAFDFAADAGVHPILSLPDKQPLDYEPQWSRSPGCYQLKSAMAWLDLSTVTGIAAPRAGYDRMLAYALDGHLSFLPGDARPERVMDRLHAYGYFLEGLVPVLERPECAAAMAAGIDRMALLLRELAPVFVRSDVYAQLLRARIHAASTGALELEARAAREEADALRAFQIDSDDPSIDGGFYFGRKAGGLMPHVNPVSAAFGMQALAMWEDHESGQREFDVADLI